MSIIVFAGPSLGPSQELGDERALERIDFRPPAACGDVLRAVCDRPKAIGLIDGLFETSAAPWHKEILWALAEGIAVFGASSMGAIRAVELEPFGMQGIGRIFHEYRSGVLEDDDEIAVQHGPAETGYVMLSEAMVNVRATVAAACGARLLDACSAEAVVRSAKRLFYKDRTWERIVRDAAAQGSVRGNADTLTGWLRDNRVDVKRQDALELVSVLSSDALSFDRERKELPFVNTLYFERLRRTVMA
jgi:hypothetical protein